jgi:mannitol-1-phosphate 5-dehydrogenase
MLYNPANIAKKDTILAAKEIVRTVGFGLANLMYRIHQGDVYKPDWTERDRKNVRGTVVYLLGGAIGTHGYTRQLLPLIARRQIAHLDPEFERKLQIFTPEIDSAHAGAFGSYFLALPEQVKEEVRKQAESTYANRKIPILPLLDVGGTKVNLVLAYIGRDGRLTLDILQSHRFVTPISEPESFYCRLASLLASPLLALKTNSLFELIPVLAVGQPGRFNHPKGEIGCGTAKDLGVNFPGCVPSALLAKALSGHVGEIDVYCGNDGISQFLGIGAVSQSKEPEKWKQLGGQKVVYLGLGTGLGAGFGYADDQGTVIPFTMHNAFDIWAKDLYEKIPLSPYLSKSLLDLPYLYGDLLSSKSFRKFMQQVDLCRLDTGRDMVFVPHSSANHLSPEQARALLANENQLSPMNAILVNDLLNNEIVTAITEEIVERNQSALEKHLSRALVMIADELDKTLLNNVRKSQYAEVIEEVATTKRRGRRIQFIGIGKSHSIGRDLAYIYSNLGIESTSCELTGANSENLTNLHEDDLVFLLSYSGQAAELLQLIPYIHAKNCRTVVLTGDPKSPLAKQCTYLVNTYVTCNPHPIAEAPTTSTTSALAAGTAIGMVVSYLFDYPTTKFFLDHPELQMNVKFPILGVRADASFDRLAKVEDIFRRFAGSIRGLFDKKNDDFVSRMIALTKRILISHYNGRAIFFTGAGASLRVAEKIAATLTSIGIDASAINSAQLPHGDFRHIRSGDLLVIISFSGQTRHLLHIRELARQKRVDCAAITAQPDSDLARQCQGELCVIAGNGADDADLVPVPDQKILSSFINLTVGDALAVILSHILGRTQREFAEEAHPGGEIGRRQARLSKPLLAELAEDLAKSIADDPNELARINRNLPVPVDGIHLQSYLRRRLVTVPDIPEVMIFGMGGIGLAYLAPLFNELGKTIWFIESNPQRIKAMQKAKYRYSVQRVGSEGSVSYQQIGRVSVIPSNDLKSITANALRVDTIFTAVGLANIEALFPTLADIIRIRYEFWLEEPFNILFSENFPVEENPLAHVRHKLREILGDPELKVYFDSYVGLGPAIDEAIVPEVSSESIAHPIIIEEKPAILYLHRRAWCGRIPDLGKHIVFTESFLPLHMRKLWVHNMGHAVIGYLGYFAGYQLVHEAVKDPEIEKIAKCAMQAIGHELDRRWSYHDTQHAALDMYINWRWIRYSNEALNDRISRLCRDPQRKLKRDDRLIGAVNYVRRHAPPGTATDEALVAILIGVVAAMHYAVDVENADYSSLRTQVLADFVNVDSELLNRAERWFVDFLRAQRKCPAGQLSTQLRIVLGTG